MATKQRMRPISILGIASAVLYLSCIVLANWAIEHIGTSPAPGAPKIVPVGFGLSAPAGVYFVGLAFTLRDVTQRLLGRWATVIAILIGAGLSAIVSPDLALASGTAFLLSEMADFAVYTPLVDSGRAVLGVVLSNVVGSVIDSALFLYIAFHSLDFFRGQVVGKLIMTAAALPLVYLARRWLASDPDARQRQGEFAVAA